MIFYDQEILLKESQTFKTYWTESYKNSLLQKETQKLQTPRTKCCCLFLPFFLFTANCASFAFALQKVYTNLFWVKLEIQRNSSSNFGKCFWRTFLALTFYIFINQTKRCFYKQHFYKQRHAEIGKKNWANAKQHPEADILLFDNCSHSLSMLSSKNNSTYSIK